MKKVLFASHVANFSKFNRPFMRWFRALGWEVHYASMGEEEIPDCDKSFVIPFRRSPLDVKNIVAIRKLAQIIAQESYALIHCHTPMGGVVTRLAAKKYRKKQNLKVLYTAHGFHFYKGAPLINWLVYYTVEKWLARYTDRLITINEEDYQRAVRRRFRSGSIHKIDGVGVNLTRFSPVIGGEKANLRETYGYGVDDFILLYVAEFIPRKNHRFLLRNLQELRERIPNLRILLAGKGELLADCQEECAALEMDDIVDFLGYRNDIDKLCQLSDVLLSTSKQEGLPINVIEAMASGLPVVCTNIRGHSDAVVDGQGGFLVNVDDDAALTDAVMRLYSDKALKTMQGAYNRTACDKFSVEKAVEAMAEIYTALF